MVNEESHEIVSEPDAGAPHNSEKPPNETVIEGEASRLDADGVAPEPEVVKTAPELEAEAARSEPPPPYSPPRERPAAPPQARPTGWVQGLVAGLVGGALVAGAANVLLPANSSLSEADANRLAALELTASREGSAIDSLEKRVQSLQGASTAALAAVDKRVGALETRAPAPSGAHATDNKAAEGLSDEVKTIRADVDAVRGEIPKIAPLTDRIDKMESALAAAKAEKPPSDNPAAVAIVADTLRDKLASGVPFRQSSRRSPRSASIRRRSRRSRRWSAVLRPIVRWLRPSKPRSQKSWAPSRPSRAAASPTNSSLISTG